MIAESNSRTLSLWGATGVGVGAIVGGGILALAGVAFATAGPGAIVAFGLNGVIAFLTAVSFAELAVRFPQSGGTYTYARKVLTVEAAFGVGWIVWFASVVAAVLYALGFAVFFVPLLEQVVSLAGGTPPAWMGGRIALLVYALGAVGFYVWSLAQSASGGGQWATVGKVVLFVLLILAGVWALIAQGPPAGEVADRFRPFFVGGGAGIAQAMGYTFIALQGFDLIAAVGGKVKDPKRNIPRAMFMSLGIALVIYLPLLLLIVAVGSPGEAIAEVAARDPEILVAVAVRNFLGEAGYWIVVVVGVLSMLSALQANMLAASHFAATMATDRTLPRRFGTLAPGVGTPIAAIRLTGITIAFVLVAVPNVAAAGAVASLIFLASFTLTHAIGYLARKRAGAVGGFRTLCFPAVPLVGGAACLALGLYQALAVPSAGVLTALWLSVGAVLYALYLGPRARVVDASSEGLDPQMMKLRGRQPLVLVPIANPASAEALVVMAKALAPPLVSRIQLLSVVGTGSTGSSDRLDSEVSRAQSVLGIALNAALAADLRPEALVTLHDDKWSEIARVAQRTRCESLLLGVGHLDGALMVGPLGHLIEEVEADVVILRAPSDWRPDAVERILIPSRLGREQSPIRARLLGSLGRTSTRDVTYLGVLPEATDVATAKAAERSLRRLANDEVVGQSHAEVILSDDVFTSVVDRAAQADLLILGLNPAGRNTGVFGDLMLRIAQGTSCPLVMISQRR